MDALLLIDTTAPAFSAQPPPELAELVERARGVNGVVVHVAGAAAESPGSADAGTDEAGAAKAHEGESGEGDVHEGEAGAAGRSGAGEGEPAAPAIETVFGTGEDELVLVSEEPDAFEGVEELALGLDDLGIQRLIVAGSDARGALHDTAMAAIVLGFEVLLLAEGVRTSTGETVPWLAEAEAAGAVVRPAGGVWLKM